MNDGSSPLAHAAQVLAALRAQGAAAREPLALARLEATVRRGQAQDAAVQCWLAPRVDAAVAALQARLAAEACTPMTAPAAPAAPRVGLAALAGAPAAELRTVQRLRPTLARLRVQRQLARAQARQPDNPGPLNSEHLLVRALQQMQALAPAYLGPFITQVEALLWLDTARGAGRADAARGTRTIASR